MVTWTILRSVVPLKSHFSGNLTDKFIVLQKLTSRSFAKVLFPLLNLRSIQLRSAYWQTCYFRIISVRQRVWRLHLCSIQTCLSFPRLKTLTWRNLVKTALSPSLTSSSGLRLCPSCQFSTQFIFPNISAVNLNYPFVLLSYLPIAHNSKIQFQML